MNKFFYLLFAALPVFFCAGCAEKQNADTAAGNEPKSAGIRFADQTLASGVDFEHIPTRTDNKHLPEIMGGGVVVADFNRDGAPDLLLVNSGALDTEKRPEKAGDRLYVNDGRGKFTERGAGWNLTATGYGQGAAVGDFDNDGLTDVFLTNFEGDNRLLRNTGSGFTDVTTEAGLTSDGRWATSAGFFDYDNDGDLDLYVVNYVKFSTANPHKVYRNRMQIYSTPIYYEAQPDRLWRNDGNGRFTDVSAEAGIGRAAGNGLALAIGDIDRDNDQDIYVANDSDANFLWINENGKFTETARLSGSAYSETGREQGSMGADLSDTDGNGLPDIIVTNFQEEPTALYRQTEPLLFREVSDAAGIGETARQRLSFGIEFFDADNDGDEDLLVANGHIEDNVEKNSDSVTFAQQNTLYENTGDGNFVDITDRTGPALADRQVSRGLAVADFDSDGDLDYVVVNNGGRAQVAFNETARKGNFAGFWLEGKTANRSAIGARLVARIGKRKIEREVMGAQSYLSVSDFRVHFGLGRAEKIDELEIYWPGGEKQVLKDIQAGKYYRLEEGGKPVEFTPGTKKFAS